MEETKMKSKKGCGIFFLIDGVIVMGIGLFASISYLKAYAIDNSGQLDDLQSGIVTCFFILPLGIYIFYLGLKLITSKAFNPTEYGNKAVCVPLIVINFIGIILSLYIAFKYDIAFIALSIVLILIICLLLFIMIQSLDHPGLTIKSKSRHFVALTLTKNFYIDGVDIFDRRNNVGVKTKKISLFLKKHCLGQVDQVYIIQGQTTKFYVAILEYDGIANVIYYVNFKPLMYLSFNGRENAIKNVEANKAIIKEMIVKEGYTLESEVAYKITKINEEKYHLEINEVLPFPCFKLEAKPTIITHYPVCEEDFKTLEEAEQELRKIISALDEME